VCVAEVANWVKDTPGKSLMSSMYVLVYNSKTTLSPDEYSKTFIQADGYGRTMMFVRSDDFMNW